MSGERQMTFDDSIVGDRLAAVQDDIAEAGRSDVRIVAVTKGFDRSAVDCARRVGLTDVGENYAQEVLEKAEAFTADLDVHFIGRVQRNKVRKIAEHIALWHSVARPEIVVEVAKRSPGASILIQVRPGDDTSKDGVHPSELDLMFETARAHEIDVAGLMTIGVLGDATATRNAFVELDRLASSYGVAERSMGMSGDYRDALAAGATILRLGSVLFGDRPQR